jgi:glycosyltransferase involved in cell wall biosynthesis
VEVCENGILCEVESVEALAEGIKRMMEDEEYRKEVQSNSVERSKAYSVERIVQRWENLFDQIIY